MRSFVRFVRLAAIVILPAACFWHHSPASSSLSAPATLQVENHNWQDVDIQILHGGIRTRLGSVIGASDKTFVFPRSVMGDLGEVQLIAHAVGTAETITTEVIVLKPGTQVRWTLETTLNRSAIAVQ